MAPRDPESSDDDALLRLQPQALLARGLTETASTASPAPAPASASVARENPLANSSTTAVADELLAELFPEYRFEGLLGGGGFGAVYRAEHRRLKRRVAVKILSGALTRSTAAVARFEREIEAVGKLDDPRIVRAFDGGQREGVWFLAMELVEGVDFGALSRVLGPLPAAEACELARQAALALQHAHERGLIHRDVKPGNLMLAAGPDGAPVVKVLDFGLAQLVCGEQAGGELTLSSDFLGTVDYVAPEQIENPRTADARADLYSLGATLYRLLSGQVPHGAPDAPTTLYAKLLRITRDESPSIALRRPDLPEGLAAVVDRMLARDPAQRFSTAGEAAAALAPHAGGSDLASTLAKARASLPATAIASGNSAAARKLPSSRRARRRRKILALTVVTVVTVVVATLVALIVGRRTPALPVSNHAKFRSQPRDGDANPSEPMQIPTYQFTTFVVDAQTVPRVVTTDWKYADGYRLGTPKSAQFHPDTGDMFFCAGKGGDGGICSMSLGGNFKHFLGGVGAQTLALAADGHSAVWSDLTRGAIGRISLGQSNALPNLDYRDGRGDGRPLGLAFPPRTWQGPGFILTDGLLADGGTNGSKGLWRFSFGGGVPRQVVTNLELLEQPVDVTFTRKEAYVLNRETYRTETGAGREEDYRQRLLRLAGDRVIPCVTDQPIADPCGLTWDPLTDDLYVYCGPRLQSERNQRRLVRLHATGKPDHFAVSEVFVGFRYPTDSGVDISPDGQLLMLTENAGPEAGVAFIYLFERRTH